VKLIVVALLMAGCSNEPKAEAQDDKQLIKIVKDLTKKYAYEAYPQWAASHPDKACPVNLAELDEYIGRKDDLDAWKHPYKMFCGANMPAGVKGIGVLSFGPDGKEGTADDIKSWQ
jgi:hypothetical protein